MALLLRSDVLPLIRSALREDQASRDLTSRLLLSDRQRLRARLVVKAPGIVAGAEVAAWAFQALDRSLRCRVVCRDGRRVRAGQTVLVVKGRARSILSAERTALNLLGHLSGVATLTRQFVLRSRPHRVEIFDTRKTLPGLRLLEKHAVRLGGGHNHRADLREAILIKTSHLRTLATTMVSGAWGVERGKVIAEAVGRARHVRPKPFVEIEVTDLEEFRVALKAQPDAILLDNMSLRMIHAAVSLRTHSSLTTHHAPLLEVSGGVTLENVQAIAATGIDRISIGRLTHSAPSLDVSLIIDQGRLS